MRSWVVLVGSLVASVLAVGIAVQVASPPESGEAVERRERGRKAKAKGKSKAQRQTAQERRAERREERALRREARAARRAELAERREQRPKKEPKLSPEEKALARAETRSAQIDELLMLHDDVCIDLGIDADVADEVAILLMDTSDLISAELERVDRGELEWEDVRPKVRKLRLDQASRVESLMGTDVFGEWTDAMGFERFSGDEWTRGRLGE
jgi:hypothetical protein